MEAISLSVHTAHDIGRHRTMSYDVAVIEHIDLNGAVRIPHDVVRHRNDIDSETELGSIFVSVVTRCRASATPAR